MAKVKAPNKNYDGITYGVQFENGCGNTDDAEALHWLEQHGYTVEWSHKTATTQPEPHETHTPPKRGRPSTQDKE